jgi:enediyne biosynthesis protein E4
VRLIYIKWLVLLSILQACNAPASEPVYKNTLFRLIPEGESGVSFQNNLTYTESLNTYTFRNFYNGGGVGLADFNNDGLVDIFFSGNLVPNKLFLNKGKLRFEDISESAGVNPSGVWTTGVSIADINSDGFLDLYICKSGPPGGERRYNELFINNGDLTFSEKSREYGLAFEGLSTHAAFFDFDKDGDLDCYLLNNSFRPVGGFDLRKDQRKIPDPNGGNKLLRNDKGKFVDVTAQAGIYSSEIGFGLGVTVGDINQDGWQDMFVSNDFFEKDYLYVNNGDGTFREDLESCMHEISMGSMGADMADLNNDAYPEIFVTEMLPEHDDRLKTTSQFENYNHRMVAVNAGYYHQFSRNALQLNNGNGTFSEISRQSGVHATDWSWGALIFDMDNDGLKDIFVANGIYKDLLDQDYVNFIATPDFIRQSINKKTEVLKQLIDSIPTNKIPNYAFKNDGGMMFTNHAQEWGLGIPTHSNGSAYADLDNDGDLDLVLNNVNMNAHVYENKTNELLKENNSLSVLLQGDSVNRFAIGTKVKVFSDSVVFYQELSPMRGFMSTVDYKLHFGLGTRTSIDSIVIEWPNQSLTTLRKVAVNQVLKVNQEGAVKRNQAPVKNVKTNFTQLEELAGVDFVHQENDFIDFDRDRLLFNMVSNEGPCLCTGDINKDGLPDFYIGGAKGQSGALYMQEKNGSFIASSRATFEADKDSEDIDCAFFDADGDGRLDLYVASGGNEFSSSSFSLSGRLYFQKQTGRFTRSAQLFPVSDRFESTSVVAPFDFNDDGYMDMFVGTRLMPFRYGFPCNGYLLQNDGHGKFTNVGERLAPALMNVGMITDAKWADINRDGKSDLIVVGEWMGIKVLINEAGRFTDRSKEFGFENSQGWYNAIEVSDVDKNGFPDIIVGNHGLNSRFKASEQEPLSLYVHDFDNNGDVEHILTRYDEGRSLPLVLRNDLIAQLPYLKKKFLYFDHYKGKTMEDIFTEQQLRSALVLHATTLESACWLNMDGKRFTRNILPFDAQMSPVYAIVAEDYDGDGKTDLLLGGNLYRAKPETGIYDASYGAYLKGDGRGGFTAVPPRQSGISIKGEIRALKKFRHQKDSYIFVARNNASMAFLKY